MKLLQECLNLLQECFRIFENAKFMYAFLIFPLKHIFPIMESSKKYTWLNNKIKNNKILKYLNQCKFYPIIMLTEKWPGLFLVKWISKKIISLFVLYAVEMKLFNLFVRLVTRLVRHRLNGMNGKSHAHYISIRFVSVPIGWQSMEPFLIVLRVTLSLFAFFGKLCVFYIRGYSSNHLI